MLKVENSYWNVNNRVSRPDWTASCRKTTAYMCNSRANWSMFYIRAIDCRNSLHVRFTPFTKCLNLLS